jgi:Swiss Army Knife RNA repair-like protein
MKVIFLDIDGVLNCYNKGEKWRTREDRVPMIHDDLVERLNRIIDATGSKLVLSSTWRQAKDWHETMTAAGIRDVFLGRTGDLSDKRWDWQKENPDKSAVEFCKRGKEIEDWLEINQYGVTKYCVLDDDSDILPHQKHFKTSIFEGGLTEEIADQVIAYMNA